MQNSGDLIVSIRDVKKKKILKIFFSLQVEEKKFYIPRIFYILFSNKITIWNKKVRDRIIF